MRSGIKNPFIDTIALLPGTRRWSNTEQTIKYIDRAIIWLMFVRGEDRDLFSLLLTANGLP